MLEVAPERYRLRFVNASDSRFLNLSLQAIEQTVLRNGRVKEKVLGEVPFYQVGSEQGLLPRVVRIETGFATTLPGTGLDVCTTGGGRPKVRGGGAANTACVNAVPGTFAQQALLMGPAERPDVIVDFSGLPDGTVVRMINTGTRRALRRLPGRAGRSGDHRSGDAVRDQPGTGESSRRPQHPGCRAGPGSQPRLMVHPSSARRPNPGPGPAGGGVGTAVRDHRRGDRGDSIWTQARPCRRATRSWAPFPSGPRPPCSV